MRSASRRHPRPRRCWSAAANLDVEDQLLEALRSDVHAMCVGPVTSQPLIRKGVPTSSPERMRLGALARHIAEELPLLGSCTVPAAGHTVDIRGTCVLVDGSIKVLSPSGMADTARAGETTRRRRRPRRPVTGAARQQQRPACRRHGRAAAANGFGRQEHRRDGGQARLPARDRTNGRVSPWPDPGRARHAQTGGCRDGRRRLRRG